MEDNKSFREEEKEKETAQPAKVTENGPVNGESGSRSSPNKNLEILSKESLGTNDNKDEEDKPGSTSWWLTGWGVHYGSRD